MRPQLLERLLQLTSEAQDALAAGLPLSSVIQKAIRIARLRGDWENLWCLELQMASLNKGEFEEVKKRLVAETAPFMSPPELKNALKIAAEAYFADRELVATADSPGIKKGEIGVKPMSVVGFERALESLGDLGDQLVVPTGLHPVDLYFRDDEMRKAKLALAPLKSECRIVLDRVSKRIHTFLSVTERQLLVGQHSSDIFERTRQSVDARLMRMAPDVAEQLAATYERLDSDQGPEALTHALTSCRRALKFLADAVYPAIATPVIGPDGKSRSLTDDKFINRLRQALHEKAPDSTARRGVLVQLEDVGSRLDHANDSTSKGVHAMVSRADAEQCVIQTYLLIGDLLRLLDTS